MLPILPDGVAWLLPALLIGWAAVYAFGLRTGKPSEDRSRHLPGWARLVMIAIHVAMGMLWLLGSAQGTPASTYALWIMGGLIFGALGDLALGNMLPLGSRAEIAGVGLFAVGHVLYLTAILTLRALLDLPAPWIAVGASILIGLILWLAMVNNPERGVLNWASLPYALLLIALTGLAVDLALRTGGMWRLAGGLLLFAASDLLLAQSLIRRQSFPYLHDLVWLLYGVGQLLIAISVGEAVILLASR